VLRLLPGNRCDAPHPALRRDRTTHGRPPWVASLPAAITLLLVGAAPSAIGSEIPGDGTLFQSVGKGFYDVQSPGGNKARLLPPSGTADQCRPGDARDIRWSPDGRRLAVTVDDGDSLTLCIYQLRSLWLTMEPRRIRVERPSAMMFQKPASQGTFQAFQQAMGTGHRRAHTEHEASWAPENAIQGGKSRYPAPIAFSHGREGHPTRTFGLKGLDFGPRCEAVPLDGQSRFETDATQPFYQPSWLPDIPQSTRPPGMAEVTQGNVSCGTERIVYLADPACTQAKDCRPPLIELANACGTSTGNGAVRFPAWSPVATDDTSYRLAFVRIDPGVQQEVCIRFGPLHKEGALEHCFDDSGSGEAVSKVYPVWSRDGRYLAYYEIKPTGAVSRTSGVRARNMAVIKAIDLGPPGALPPEPPPRPTVLLEGVVPNPEHGPPMVTWKGRTWVFAITSDDGVRYDGITAMELGTPPARVFRVDPGLQNLKALDVTLYRPGKGDPELRFGMVAQGYRNMAGADQSVDKVFVHVLSLDQLE